MNDKKKNVETKPEEYKKTSQTMDNEEITDFDEMRKNENTKKNLNSEDTDTGKDSIEDSQKADYKKDTNENADKANSSKKEPEKAKIKKEEITQAEKKKASKKGSEHKDELAMEKNVRQKEQPALKKDSKQEEKPEPKNDFKQEEKLEPKNDSKQEEKLELKNDSKQEEKPELKKDSKQEQKLEPKKDSRRENQTELKKKSKQNDRTEQTNGAFDSGKESQSKAVEKKENTTKNESAQKENTDKNVDKKTVSLKEVPEKEGSKKEAGEKIQEPSKDKIKENDGSPQKHKNKKILWITSGIIAGILLIAYLTGFIYFSGHFYQSASINGLDVSDMNQENAKQTLDYFYKNYVLTLETIDGDTIPINGKDISMQITLRDEFSSCFKQQRAYLWFINMFKHYDFNLGADTTWNQSQLSNIFDSMKILNKKSMTAPEDAYVGVKDGKFTIVHEVMGDTINIDRFKQAVENGLTNVVSTLVLKDEDCYELPKVYSTDEELKKDLDTKNEFAQKEIKIQLDDLVLEPGMELYDAVLEKKTDGYEISEKLVGKYVKSLAKKYNTLGEERNFTTSFNDRQIKMSGTAFGYEINQDETTSALYKALKAGKSTTVDVLFNEKGYTLKGENDIGDTYIEVNLSEQKVFAYKNGEKIAEGDCVSGNESAGHGTCTGLYAVQNKLSPTVLRGEKKPVTKTTTKKKKGKKVKVTTTTYEYEYESPVTFWMQFNGGIGLHDAAGWRSSYGGSIYYYNGSHGCVNLPYSLAETLYNNFDIGDPVIVYFWDNENRQ